MFIAEIRVCHCDYVQLALSSFSLGYEFGYTYNFRIGYVSNQLVYDLDVCCICSKDFCIMFVITYKATR